MRANEFQLWYQAKCELWSTIEFCILSYIEPNS